MFEFLVNNLFEGKGFLTDSWHSNGYKLCPPPSRHISVLIRSRIHTVFCSWPIKTSTLYKDTSMTYYLLITQTLRIISVRSILPSWRSNTTESNTSGFSLDLILSIGRDGYLGTSLLRQGWRFWIPYHKLSVLGFLSHNSYGYGRACSSCESFVLKTIQLPNNLIRQGNVRIVWNRILGGSMVDTGIVSNNMKPHSCYKTFLRMTICSDTLHWSDTNQCVTLLPNWTLLPNLTFYQNVWGFNNPFAQIMAYQQRTLTPSDTWLCPLWDFLWHLRFGCLFVPSLDKENYLQFFNVPSFYYKAFVLIGKVGIPLTGLTTPVGRLSLLQLTVLSDSTIVVLSNILVACLCCQCAFWSFLWV